jgi:hypothetical protein
MKAETIKKGMLVYYSNGNVIKVTHVPKPDKYGCCFFSGVLMETKNDELYGEYVGKNCKSTWNNLSCMPFRGKLY